MFFENIVGRRSETIAMKDRLLKKQETLVSDRLENTLKAQVNNRSLKKKKKGFGKTLSPVLEDGWNI